MTKESFELWYRKNYISFLEYKARWFIQSFGKNYSDISELISQTVENLYKNLEKIDEKTINSFAFITMQNTMRNMYVNGFHNKAICCSGDLMQSDIGTTEDFYLDQSKLVDVIEEPQEIQYKPNQLELIDNYTKLLPHEQKIIDCYAELKSVSKVAKMLNIDDGKITWLIKKVRTGAFKQKGFQNLNKNCYICGGKHFSKGLCCKHYQDLRRGKL